jgi:hypothetical protein
MPFLIVDNLFVLELRCPKSQLVVSIRGSQDKTFSLQERFHQFVLVRGPQVSGYLSVVSGIPEATPKFFSKVVEALF